MVLAIDIGNTCISIGAFSGEKLLFLSQISTRAEATSDEYAIKLRHILSLYGYEDSEIEGAIISSVVPPLSRRLFDAVKRLRDVRVFTVGPGLRTGLNIKIDQPAQLGSDLVCVAVAALERYPAPLIVIDMSTAVTFIAVDRSGVLTGCSIVPGMELSLNALADGTAQLQKIDLTQPVVSAVGRNTQDSMRAGSVLGTACMIDGMVERMKEELGEAVTVVATGEQFRFVSPYLRQKILFDESLLIDGLRLLYGKNRK